jgi:hypothetical protein
MRSGPHCLRSRYFRTQIVLSLPELKNWPGRRARLAESMCAVSVFCLSIGGAASCPKDAGEEDGGDNGDDEVWGSNHG